MWKPPGEASRGSRGLLTARKMVSLVPGLEGEALWWENGRIREVGAAGDLHRRVPAEVPRFDLPHTLVTPGFVDGHTHFAMWALGRRRVRLAGCTTRAEAVARVAQAEPVQGWVLGQGWDANGWKDAPSRQALDAVQAGPVYLDSLDVHAAWVNSAALVAAGVTRATPDPFGGRIVRDGNGEPTGLLLERAVELVSRVVPIPSPDDLDSALREAQTEAHRLGITGIHDVEDLRVWDGFRRLEQAGDLALRVLFHPPVAALPTLVRDGVRSGDGTPWLTVGGVKMFLDGSLGSRTAWMLEPYAGTRERGMPITDEAEARAAMRLAAEQGIAVTAHAIGDAAVRRALDLMTPLPKAAVPHRIEHFQCVHAEDLDRAASAGLVASMQPAHLLTDIPLVERHWAGRERGAYAFRSLLQRGTTVVFGSDTPVATLDPRAGMAAALEREGWRVEERLAAVEAIRAYTAAAALAGGVEHRRGALAPGYDADLVAWAVDPAAERGDGCAWREGHPVLTVVGGRVVMQR